METINITHRIDIFGNEVKTFPLGVEQAFDKLVNVVEGGLNRRYYGLCFQTSNGFRYIAAAEEKFPGEGSRYGCASYQIDPGPYATVTIHDWRNRIDEIKTTFCKMLENEDVDDTSPSVELYENDDVMKCMIRLKEQSK